MTSHVRKSAHIELASKAQTLSSSKDDRFFYEPLFFSHPKRQDTWKTKFLGFDLDYPLWVSSMTGGTEFAQKININLARLAEKYHLGMGLGSCRSLLESNDRIEDFAVKKYMGQAPLFANLGIAQIEELLLQNKLHAIDEMMKKTEADGLIVHLNPLQEWFQPEGDRYALSPFETLNRFLEKVQYKIIVKEVGQGMGPRSLEALLEMPIAGIEFGAFGGTNFAQLEHLRSTPNDVKAPFIHVGHTALEMVDFLNALPKAKQKDFIISGGVKTALDGYELLKKLNAPGIIGMAHSFLNPALESFEVLDNYFNNLRESLLTARDLLSPKEEL